MTAVYVCIQTSVYHHAITGVYMTIDEAIDGAREAILAEHDHFHTITVYEVPLGQLVEFTERGHASYWESVGEMTWRRDDPAPPLTLRYDTDEARQAAGNAWSAWKKSGMPVWRRHR